MADKEDTRSQEEYDSMCSSYNSSKNEAEEKESYVDGLKNTLKRLDEAYSSIKKYKEDLSSYKSQSVDRCYELYNDGDYVWVGSNYDDAESQISDEVTSQFVDYIDRVDGVLDDIGRLRTEYENKILEETTILSGLWKALNSLWDDIKNYWN